MSTQARIYSSGINQWIPESAQNSFVSARIFLGLCDSLSSSFGGSTQPVLGYARVSWAIVPLLVGVCLQFCWSASVSLRIALHLSPSLPVFNMVRKGCIRVGGIWTWTSKCHVCELLLDAVTRGCEPLKLITSFSALGEGELWSSSSLALTVTPITAPALL